MYFQSFLSKGNGYDVLNCDVKMRPGSVLKLKKGTETISFLELIIFLWLRNIF